MPEEPNLSINRCFFGIVPPLLAGFWACSGIIDLGGAPIYEDADAFAGDVVLDDIVLTDGREDINAVDATAEDISFDILIDARPNCLVENSIPVDDNALCPETARIIGSHEIEGGASGIYVQGDCAFIIANTSWLLIFDIRDLEDPSLISSLDVRPQVGDIFVSGPTVFVASGNGWMCLVDITNITNPILRSCYEHVGHFNEVYAEGTYAYVANSGRDSGGLLHILDISDIDNIQSVTVFDTPGLAPGLFISDTSAFIADRYSLEILSLEDIANPRIVGSIEGTSYIHRIRVQGDYAYALDPGIMDGTLMIFDVSDVRHPREVSSYEREGQLRNFVVQGKYAYIVYTDFPGGVYIIDVENPFETDQAGFARIRLATDVFVRSGYAYVSGGAESGGVGSLSIVSLLCEY